MLNLGGQDFDYRILAYAITEIVNTSKVDILQKPKLLKRLRGLCRFGKEALSFQAQSYNIQVS